MDQTDWLTAFGGPQDGTRVPIYAPDKRFRWIWISDVKSKDGKMIKHLYLIIRNRKPVGPKHCLVYEGWSLV